jgi:hypothetical protein
MKRDAGERVAPGSGSDSGSDFDSGSVNDEPTRSIMRLVASSRPGLSEK